MESDYYKGLYNKALEDVVRLSKENRELKDTLRLSQEVWYKETQCRA